MIDTNKTYNYRIGKVARILCNDGPDSHAPVISIDPHGDIWRHDADGFVNRGSLCDHDLIEVIPKWRGELWVHPDGAVRHKTSGSEPHYPQSHGWRMITAEEVETTPAPHEHLAFQHPTQTDHVTF